MLDELTSYADRFNNSLNTFFLNVTTSFSFIIGFTKNCDLSVSNKTVVNTASNSCSNS